MNTIRLKCHTLGRGFGEIIKVGNKENEISKEDAKRLVDEGHAEVLADIVVTSSKELKRDLDSLKVENEKLKSELEALQIENGKLKAENVELASKLVALQADYDALKTPPEPGKDGKK